MKYYKVNKVIMLSFIVGNEPGTQDEFIDPDPKFTILSDDHTVYIKVEDKTHETINTIGSLNSYIKDGSLIEIFPKYLRNV